MTSQKPRRSARGALLGAALAGAMLLTGPVFAQDATPMPYTPGTELGELSGSIVMDGSSTVGPIGEAVAEDFNAQAGDVEIAVDISGTGGGFERFCNGETDFQNASRDIEEDELALCAEAGVEFYRFEVAYDGLSVVVNPENDFVTCITTAELSAMWAADSTADSWNDINAAWPDQPLTLYGPGTDSGTYDYFVDEIIGDAGSRSDFTPSEDDNVLVEGVAGDENALAFFGYAYYEQNQDRLKLLEVDSGSGCVAPSPETVQGLTYTPLSRPLFIFVKAESLTRPEVQEFTRFMLANAATLAPEVGYVASPNQVYVDDQTKLEAAIAGTGTPDSSAADSATPTA
ncbi:MAG: PstS family phosphate ABC transporter substrate-binding protein [Actinomycetota bacterium]|nr:PstS family phosphate ABC transporter substrate-binding protein [Actinomycetota bacterium]